MYENTKRVAYDIQGDGTAYFIPVCLKCGRFVKADQSFISSDYQKGADAINATCKKCGRVKMLFEGIY